MTAPSQKNNTIATVLILILSLGILLFLFWLIYFKSSSSPLINGLEASSAWIEKLPVLNAALNSLTAIFLVVGFYFIKTGDKKNHIRSMLSAVFTSALFLISYIVYHQIHGDTPYTGQGTIRSVYFFILITHILLSMVQVPLILGTLYTAFTQNHSRHKQLARVTFPIWLYVSVTGVLIYFFLSRLN